MGAPPRRAKRHTGSKDADGHYDTKARHAAANRDCRRRRLGSGRRPDAARRARHHGIRGGRRTGRTRENRHRARRSGRRHRVHRLQRADVSPFHRVAPRARRRVPTGGHVFRGELPPLRNRVQQPRPGRALRPPGAGTETRRPPHGHRRPALQRLGTARGGPAGRRRRNDRRSAGRGPLRTRLLPALPVADVERHLVGRGGRRAPAAVAVPADLLRQPRPAAGTRPAALAHRHRRQPALRGGPGAPVSRPPPARRRSRPDPAPRRGRRGAHVRDGLGAVRRRGHRGPRRSGAGSSRAAGRGGTRGARGRCLPAQRRGPAHRCPHPAARPGCVGLLERAGRGLPGLRREPADDLPHEPPAAPAGASDLVRHPQ